MVGLAGVGLLLLTPAAPVPAPAPRPASTAIDRTQAAQFAQMVYHTALQVVSQYGNWPADPDDDNRTAFSRVKKLLAGSIRGLYEEAGVPVPDGVIKATLGAETTPEAITHLADARVTLGNTPALAGPRSLFAAINGFRHATDPYCVLAGSGVNRAISFELDFDVGVELDGATGQRLNVYRVERGVAAGQFPATGMFGPLPKLEDVPAPANYPWRVKKVIPGSPAQRAGVKPGDVVTHVNDTEISPENANRQFGLLAFPARGFDPMTGRPVPLRRTFKLRRAGEPVAIALETQDYAPETVFGVMRTAPDRWDCMLDRDYKIGYIRVGPVETGTDLRVGAMLDDLTRQGCRGLILDLRWCPGGYVDPGTKLAGYFTRPNDLIAEVRSSQPATPNGAFGAGPTAYHAPSAPNGGKFRGLPVLILVGSETTGGGELIAAALQDNDDRDNPKVAVMGQRTVGRAAIQYPIDAGFGGMQFKVTRGETLRPNGKSRGRRPDSKPTDEWGIRPDPGLEVPVTADLSRQLRQWADEHALRPADSNAALPFDDPLKDPYRTAALAYLRKKLGRPKP